MPEARSLTIRIRVDNRNEPAETDVVQKVRRLLESIEGDPRPQLEIARAEREDVAVAAPEPP